MEKLNIAEILKDCPKGMELDCALFENLEFDHIDKNNGTYPIICRVKTEWGSYNVHTFTEYGCYNTEKYSKCVIFPKDKTTWEGFQRSFKDGDVLYIDCNDYGNTNKRYQYIFILKEIIKGKIYCYCYIDKANVFKRFEICFLADQPYYPRLATEEEKQKLFNAIKENGYKWNPETKILEKLIEPKFKVGDKIVNRNSIRFPGRNSWIVISINSKFYEIKLSEGIGSIGVIPISEQDDYELLPNKFDITTLKPFDKVLVRCSSLENWHIQLFEKYNRELGAKYPFICLCNNKYSQCVPYEGNEYLLDTTNDCYKYYKTW